MVYGAKIWPSGVLLRTLYTTSSSDPERRNGCISLFPDASEWATLRSRYKNPSMVLGELRCWPVSDFLPVSDIVSTNSLL